MKLASMIKVCVQAGLYDIRGVQQSSPIPITVILFDTKDIITCTCIYNICLESKFEKSEFDINKFLFQDI